MTVGNIKSHLKLEYDGVQIPKSDIETDLGVILNKKGTGSDQCRVAAAKANKMLGMIKRTITNKTPATIIPLYKALVRPHLDYCSSVWRPYLKKDIVTVERVQRRMSKMLPGLRNLSYEDRIKNLNLMKMEKRHERADLILCYKILTNKVDIDRNIFFELSNNHLRNNGFKLEKKQIRLMTTAKQFANRIVNEWNKLPSETVNSTSLNIFKRKLSQHLKESDQEGLC